MNPCKPLSPFVGVLAVAMVIIGNCVAVPNPKARNSLVIGDYLYYSYTEENRTRSDAVAYCEAQGGELAKVLNNKQYNQLRLATQKLGAYWIDGIDRANECRFAFRQTCPGDCLDYSKVPKSNLDLPQVTCLSIVKGNTATTSKLQAANCNEERFVLCQFALDVCGGSGTEDPRAARKNISRGYVDIAVGIAGGSSGGCNCRAR